MRQIQIIITLLVLTIFSCGKKKSNLTFGQKAFNQIEQQVIDSIFKDKRFTFLFLKNEKEYSQEKKKLKKDTLRLSININDFFFPFHEIDKAGLDKFYYNSEFKIDPQYIHYNKVNSTEFSDVEIPIKYQKLTKTLSKLSCSQIEFDYQKTNGVLCVIYNYGKNNKFGYIIFINKNNNKWKVVRTMPTWIS